MYGLLLALVERVHLKQGVWLTLPTSKEGGLRRRFGQILKNQPKLSENFVVNVVFYFYTGYNIHSI